MPCNCREDRAMPLQISVCTGIEVYSGIARFLCHSTAFLYRPTSATFQMLQLDNTKYADFHGRDAKSVTAENHSI